MVKITTTVRRGIIIIPKSYTPNWDITVAGTNVDTELVECQINRLVTEGTGNFTMTLLNPNNLFNFTGMEQVIVNADFGGGTTGFFKGTVEEVKKIYDDVTKIKLSGRHISGELSDLTATENFQNIELSEIVKTLVSTYAPSYTVNNVNTTGILDSISFDHTPFFEALREIAYRANFDFYVDDDKDFHFFEAGSIANNSEAVSPTYFISSEGLGDSVIEVKNRIIVYGTTSSGLPIIHTADDTSSQALYGVREKFINDSRVNSIDVAKMLSQAYLTFNKNKAQIGTVHCLGLPTLKPGDKIYIENRPVGISGQFRVSHISDRIGDEGWLTDITAEKIGSVRFSAIFRDLMKGGGTVDFKNPNKMKYSIVDEFDNENQIESKSNMTISNSEVKQSSLGSDGQITSVTTEVSSDVTQIELRVSGQDLKNSIFAVSTNDGSLFTTVTLDQLSTVPAGKFIKIRMTLADNSTNPLPLAYGYSLLYR